MTNWDRILDFYSIVLQRDHYAQFGEKMFELVSQIRDSPRFSHVEVNTAMYYLILWIEGIDNKCLHISWEDDRYLLSLNAFEDTGHKITQQEALFVIERYLKKMEDSNDLN